MVWQLERGWAWGKQKDMKPRKHVSVLMKCSNRESQVNYTVRRKNRERGHQQVEMPTK